MATNDLSQLLSPTEHRSSEWRCLTATNFT